MYCWQDGLGTARYCRVCGGCPPREDCHNCTVDDSNLDATCSMALEHTTATGPDSTLETLSIDEGYWRATTTSSDILPCFNKAACLGGQTGSATVCDDGYMGPCERSNERTPCFDFVVVVTFTSQLDMLERSTFNDVVHTSGSHLVSTHLPPGMNNYANRLSTTVQHFHSARTLIAIFYLVSSSFPPPKRQHIKYLACSSPSKIWTPAPVRAQMALNLLS